MKINFNTEENFITITYTNEQQNKDDLQILKRKLVNLGVPFRAHVHATGLDKIRYRQGKPRSHYDYLVCTIILENEDDMIVAKLAIG